MRSRKARSHELRLERLKLVNFRGFEELDLSFEDDITLIAGINGAGKSSLLYALRVLLNEAMPRLAPAGKSRLSFGADDVHLGGAKGELNTNLWFNIRNRKPRVQIRRGAAAQERQKVDSVALPTQRVARPIHTEPLQVAVHFGPKRSLYGRPRTLPMGGPSPLLLAYRDALKDREVRLREFIDWYSAQKRSEADERGHVLETLHRAVTGLIPEFDNLRLQAGPPPQLLVDKAGHPLHLHQLSDGEQSLLALVFDLTRRLAIANPGSKNTLGKGSGVVLIDEIELHMHPQWQRKVLKRLQDIFPNCQFVVTTHSPVVLGEVEGRCIRHLYQEGGRILSPKPTKTWGRDANRILAEDMATPVRNEKAEAELGKLFDLINQDKLKEASTLIEELEAEWGGGEPELTRARALITFLEED